MSAAKRKPAAIVAVWPSAHLLLVLTASAFCVAVAEEEKKAEREEASKEAGKKKGGAKQKGGK